MNSLAIPSINYERCKGCGLCVDYCPTGAVEMIAGKPAIMREEDCAYCGICEDMCPNNAVSLSYEITL